MLCSLLEQLKKLKSYLNSAQQPPGAHGHIWNGQKQPGHGESNKSQPITPQHTGEENRGSVNEM